MEPQRTLRADIQALRALAVGLVVVFHIWPGVLPAGYVGVDVFFVISGFLITGILLRDAEAGRLSVRGFYVRRIRRLLPAATVVLIAVGVATILLFSPGRWYDIGLELAASALYFENWYLAWQATDYFAADASVSPVQHFWSLSIEEQFYIVWGPVVAMTALLFGPRNRQAITTILAIVFFASFASSVALSSAPEAYFLTHTRAWELALGGLLAASGWSLVAAHKAIRWTAAIVGLLAITITAALLPDGSNFPGWVAIFPTAGVAMVVAADLRDASLWTRIPGVQQLGDRSYSIYLWHWPLIIFTAAFVDIDFTVGLAVLAATLLLSDLSFRYVERPFLKGHATGHRRPFASAAAVVAAAGGALVWINMSASLSLASAAAGDPRYPGPYALRTGAPIPAGVDLVPPLVQLRRDVPHPPSRRCHQDQESAEPLSCVLGDPSGRKSIAIVGDSHAAQWVPALEVIAEQRGYRVITFTKSACPIAPFPVLLNGRTPYENCLEWSNNVEAEIFKIMPDFVLVAQSRHYRVDPVGMSEALAERWHRFVEAGLHVVAISDTPTLDFKPHECLGTGQICRTERVLAEDVEDPLVLAVSQVPAVASLSLNDWICGEAYCDATVGNVIAWRDNNHITATYSRMLAPALAEGVGL